VPSWRQSTPTTTLAGRITISNHHKKHEQQFSDVVKTLYENADNVARFIPLISKELYDIVRKRRVYRRGLRLLPRLSHRLLRVQDARKSYLIRKNVVERPQHMWLRVGAGDSRHRFRPCDRNV
jgi:hypothetical protein